MWLFHDGRPPDHSWVALPPVSLNVLSTACGLLHEYMGHDVSNMRGFDSYQLLTLSLAALMTRISSAIIEGAHTSAGAATLARTVPFWGRFRSPREPTAGRRAAGAYC